MEPPFRLIVSALKINPAPAAERLSDGLMVIASTPVPPSIESPALKPDPRAVTLITSSPVSPALIVKDAVGLGNVVVSPDVDETVVCPGPPAVVVMVSAEVL